MRNTLRSLVVLLALFICLSPSLAVRASSDATEVRRTVEQVFQQLKSRDYDALYNTLPTSTQARMSRERFANALRRTQEMYALERIDVRQIRVAGNIATADTILYGRVLQPIDAEVKIAVQQYLVREEGKWRVATGDRVTVQRFLAANPTFARKFPLRQPRIYIRQNETWVEFTPPGPSRRRG